MIAKIINVMGKIKINNEKASLRKEAIISSINVNRVPGSMLTLKISVRISLGAAVLEAS